jgi:ribose 5-phosphate isomerase B
MYIFKKIGVASDHAGFECKEQVKKYLLDNGFEVTDFGTGNKERCDYPDYGHALAEAVERGKCETGIAVCGSGNGINMTVNKHKGIRGALCWSVEIAQLAREHNDANICALPGRFVSAALAIDIAEKFLTTPFDGGRHKIRTDKIPVC